MSPVVFEGLLYVGVLAFCVYEIVKTRRELRETRARRLAAEAEAARESAGAEAAREAEAAEAARESAAAGEGASPYAPRPPDASGSAGAQPASGTPR
jgi:hypothetical protein